MAAIAVSVQRDAFTPRPRLLARFETLLHGPGLLPGRVRQIFFPGTKVTRLSVADEIPTGAWRVRFAAT